MFYQNNSSNKELKISARFWPIFNFELNGKGHEPSRAENLSARLGLISNNTLFSIPSLKLPEIKK